MSDSFTVPWTVALQAHLSIGFPRQKYWSWLPFPSHDDLSHPEIKPVCPAVAGGFFTTEPPGKPSETSTSPLIVTSYIPFHNSRDFPHDSSGKESACNARNTGLIPESGRYPWEVNENPLQYSCLGNPMDRGAWWAMTFGVTKCQTQLKWLTTTIVLVLLLFLSCSSPQLFTAPSWTYDAPSI